MHASEQEIRDINAASSAEGVTQSYSSSKKSPIDLFISPSDIRFEIAIVSLPLSNDFDVNLVAVHSGTGITCAPEFCDAREDRLVIIV